MPPNFVLLNATLPDVTRLVIAMVQARDAVESRSWSHPLPVKCGNDLLCDLRTRSAEQRLVRAMWAPAVSIM